MLFWMIFILLSTYPSTGGLSCPSIFSKNQWGARGAKKILYSVPPIDNVIIHHTITPECLNLHECAELLTGIQNFHMDVLNYDDIAYNFLVGGDGNVYEGRGWHKIGAHTKRYNSRSIAIAFLGTFSSMFIPIFKKDALLTDAILIAQLPNAKQLQTAKNLMTCGVQLKELSKNYKLYGARQISGTQSPGLTLYNEIQNWSHFTKRL